MKNPFVMIIFGATGDLATHKLYPALFSLFQQQQLSDEFKIVGFSRRDITEEQFREMVKKTLPPDPSQSFAVTSFLKLLQYQQGFFDDRTGYDELIEKLNAYDQKIGACVMRLFYLATPPDNYEPILSKLVETKLSEGCGQGSDKWTRLIIEKPFGKNLETAKALDMHLAEIFQEKQIFRVDHYLAKETMQNMIAFRFANGIFEPIWKKEFIDHVQITWGETDGIGTRGKFFDGVGILRDVAQNHLLQLAAAVAMEQPSSFTKEGVRDARAKAIKSIRCIEPSAVVSDVVRGQYEGYKGEKNVATDSDTETFVAMKLFVNSERFDGVPFYIRAGKKMPKDVVEISVVFIQTCHLLFKEYGCPEVGNVLTIRIQPDEGIRLRVVAKKPGTKLALDTVDMKFSYKEEFGNVGADAYEKLLLDIFADDQMLFNRSDELESSWEFITKILEGWEKGASPVESYTSKEWGPKSANELIEKDNRKWL